MSFDYRFRPAPSQPPAQKQAPTPAPPPAPPPAPASPKKASKPEPADSPWGGDESSLTQQAPAPRVRTLGASAAAASGGAAAVGGAASAGGKAMDMALDKTKNPFLRKLSVKKKFSLPADDKETDE